VVKTTVPPLTLVEDEMIRKEDEEVEVEDDEVEVEMDEEVE